MMLWHDVTFYLSILYLQGCWACVRLGSKRLEARGLHERARWLDCWNWNSMEMERARGLRAPGTDPSRRVSLGLPPPESSGRWWTLLDMFDIGTDGSVRKVPEGSRDGASMRPDGLPALQPPPLNFHAVLGVALYEVPGWVQGPVRRP
ncbi:MAG: hypothetical protein J3K34DRAFT_157664 [Monoraphidium minutum]|nr:MAG: hypothetical protein J3K34DRAFT_157664 [Monoraphidium minutum]